MWHKTTKIEALLDCGATHNFIDPRTIKTLAMGINPLKQPLTVHNVDGTVNKGGTISHYCNLWVRRGKHIEKLGFYVANLGRDRLILGYPWFTKFNPSFDWKNNVLEGCHGSARDACPQGRPRVARPSDTSAKNIGRKERRESRRKHVDRSNGSDREYERTKGADQIT